MRAGRTLAGLVGFAGGSAVVVSALVFELQARGLPMRGSLWELQTQSVLVWVVESLPFLIAFAAISIVPAAVVDEPDKASLTSPSSPIAPPPPPPLTKATATPLDAPPAKPGSDSRRAALEELVKVLRAATHRATEESRAKSSYLAGMSHSFRDPLNEIIGHSEALLASAEGEAAGGLRQIRSAARHVASVLANVLDLSKIEVGKMSLVIENVDLAQVANEVQAGLASDIEMSDCTVTVAVGPPARFARGDHMRVRQVVLNLMRHAIATSSGTVSLYAESAVHQGKTGWIAIRVRDEGAGLTEEETERLFDDYRRPGSEDPLRPRSDGGLGLAISRKLAELMGGVLEVESELGSGSTFTLLLAAADVSAPAATLPPPDPEVDLDGLSVLFVDSDPGAGALATHLSDSGLDVEVITPDGPLEEALEGKTPQIAILGAEVPDVWAAAETLVERDVRVVVLSLRDDDVEMALQLGVTGFLVRPVERPLLLATLQRCLEEG